LLQLNPRNRRANGSRTDGDAAQRQMVERELATNVKQNKPAASATRTDGDAARDEMIKRELAANTRKKGA
jgi:hypothetical protein